MACRNDQPSVLDVILILLPVMTNSLPVTLIPLVQLVEIKCCGLTLNSIGPSVVDDVIETAYKLWKDLQLPTQIHARSTGMKVQMILLVSLFFTT